MTPITLDTIDVPIDMPDFYQHIFSRIVEGGQQKESKEALWELCTEEYDQLSKQVDSSQIQDSTAIRNHIKCRALSYRLIDDKGDLQLELLEELLPLLQNHLYHLGPGRHFDAKREEHILFILQRLKQSQEMQRLLKFISKPHSNLYAEEVIRITLNMAAKSPVSDGDARRAALAALLTTLRQNVGSCFATAPAILIHDEQPELFLKDIAELFNTGRLKKTFGGIEFSVPLSFSWGAGALRQPFVLHLPEAEEELALSPGIVSGLVAAAIVDGELPPKEQLAAGQRSIFALLQAEKYESNAIVTTAERLFQKIVMQKYELVDSDLTEYNNRPQTHALNLLSPQAAAPTGKMQQCAHYYEKLEAAKIAFKSFSDNALLRTWEFTLASFSETKAQFSTWNLYSSLGLEPQEPSGIGQAIHHLLQEKLDIANRKVEELQEECDQALGHIRYLETRMRTASTEQDAEWIKMEYRSRVSEFQALEQNRNSWHRRGQQYASFLNLLIDKYSSLFPSYFQEVYDADMHEVTGAQYDDSPAGFRLIYKYGRSSTGQWSQINTPEQFVEALVSFFIAVEPLLATSVELEELQDEISTVTSAIIYQIRTEEFIESAFDRMARAHRVPPVKNPLQNLDQVAIKPWAYTSGGLMDTFVSTYWKLEDKPTEVGRWVEHPMELLVFLADCMKQMPPKTSSEYLKNRKKSLLIHSPTHAFLFKPGTAPFSETWQNDEFTYTSIRDRMILPAVRFCDNIVLDQPMAYFLKEELQKRVPENFRHYFGQVLSYFPAGMTPQEFRNYVLDLISSERGLAYGKALPPDDIDSALFSLLPLTSSEDLFERIDAILQRLPDVDLQMRQIFEKAWMTIPLFMNASPLVGADTLLRITKAAICLLFNKTAFPHNYDMEISLSAKALGFSMPMPLLFADTNWMHDDFAFAVNPGTSKCEFWRFNDIGTRGAPMSSWEQWLNGSRKDRTWGVFINPYEYTA